MNVIDTLVVALKLDPSDWIEGAAKADSAGRKLADDQAEAAQKITDAAEQAGEAQAKEAQKAEKALKAEAAAAKQATAEKEKAAKREAAAQAKLAEKIHKARMEAVDFVATSLAAAGVGKAIGSVFGGLEQLGYASKNLGLDPKTVDAYHMAIQKLGGDAGDFDQFASRVSTISSKLKQHIQLSPEEVAFTKNLSQRFKVSQQDIEQNNIVGVINSIAKAMDGLPARDQQVQLSQFLGLNPGMIRLLQQGGAGVQKLYGEEYNLSQATQDATDKATTADQTWRQLKNTFSQTGTTLLTDLAPALDKVNGMLTTFNSLLERHPQATAAGTAVTSVAGWFGSKWLMKKLTKKLFGKAAGEAAGETTVAGESAGGAAAGEAAAATEATAGTAAEAAAGAGGGLLRFLGPAGAGLYAMFHSENLNTGEASQLAKIRTLEKAGFKPPSPSKAPTPPPADTSAVSTRLADSAFGMLIARGEGDYNVVNRGAAHGYTAGTEDLPNMTVADVMAAQRGHRFNAAGRYQIIGDTLASAAKSMGLSGGEKFDRAMQDRIFSEYLVRNKRRAIGDYLGGRSNDLRAAIKAASLEWASVADPDTGRSHYAGKGNNKASISVAEMGAALQSSRAAGTMSGPSMAPMLAAASANQAGGGSTVNSSVDTHIGTINVYGMNTQDGHAVVGGMREELDRHGLALNGAYGMT